MADAFPFETAVVAARRDQNSPFPQKVAGLLRFGQQRSDLSGVAPFAAEEPGPAVVILPTDLAEDPRMARLLRQAGALS